MKMKSKTDYRFDLYHVLSVEELKFIMHVFELYVQGYYDADNNPEFIDEEDKEYYVNAVTVRDELEGVIKAKESKND